MCAIVLGATNTAWLHFTKFPCSHFAPMTGISRSRSRDVCDDVRDAFASDMADVRGVHLEISVTIPRPEYSLKSRRRGVRPLTLVG